MGANEKVVQLEEYYVQQIQMKEVQMQTLTQQLQQTFIEKQSNKNDANNSLQSQMSQPNAVNNEELKKELISSKELCAKLSGENGKLSSEISALKHQSARDREEAKAHKKRNEANESKISAYNASFIELAEK